MTAVVFIDLKKAFDNVQHQLLLLKLQQHGIGGTVLAWFWNYLSQRTQNVVLNGSSSNYFCSFKGVPQGSVIGPLLFNLYVADLPEIARENRVAPSFADDIVIVLFTNNRIGGVQGREFCFERAPPGNSRHWSGN